MIDREWIKVDWCGDQTLNHRMLSAAPLLIAGAVSGLLPSYSAGVIVVAFGILAMVLVSLWIEARRLAGTGAFSSQRSEKFVRRQRRKRARVVENGMNRQANSN